MTNVIGEKAKLFLRGHMIAAAAKYLNIKLEALEFKYDDIFSATEKTWNKTDFAIGYPVVTVFRNGAVIKIGVSASDWGFILVYAKGPALVGGAHGLEVSTKECQEFLASTEEVFAEYDALYEAEWAPMYGKRLQRIKQLIKLPWYDGSEGKESPASKAAQKEYYAIKEALEVEAYTVIEKGTLVQFEYKGQILTGVAKGAAHARRVHRGKINEDHLNSVKIADDKYIYTVFPDSVEFI